MIGLATLATDLKHLGILRLSLENLLQFQWCTANHPWSAYPLQPSSLTLMFWLEKALEWWKRTKRWNIAKNSKHQWLITNSGRSASQSSKARKGSVGSNRKQTKAKFLRAIRMTEHDTHFFNLVQYCLYLFVEFKLFSIFMVISSEFYHVWISGIPAAAQAFARIPQHPTPCLHVALWKAIKPCGVERSDLEFGKLLTNHFWIVRGWENGSMETRSNIQNCKTQEIQQPFSDKPHSDGDL